MHAWEAIQKTVDHIEAHIGQDIQIEDLAEIAALSLFYYQRLFARLVKRPVREYIKLRRLARARSALRDRGNRIVDVAMDYGFGSHETFTRAFKDAYGITPAQYRAGSMALNDFDRPDLLLNYVMVDEGVPLISDGLVLEMNRRELAQPIDFLGVAGHVPFRMGKMLGERPGVDASDEIRRRFFGMLGDIPRLPGGRIAGVTHRGDAPEGHTTCFLGAEVAPGEARGALTLWRMPTRAYVVCGFEAENAEQMTAAIVGKAMKYTRIWLKAHGLIADGFFPEIYYPDAREAAYMELWIPFRHREGSPGCEATSPATPSDSSRTRRGMDTKQL